MDNPYRLGSSGTLTIQACIFQGNAANYGGAIDAFAPSGGTITITISDTKFESNTVSVSFQKHYFSCPSKRF